MKMIHQMILDSRTARKFAGQVTAEMIRLGASPSVMQASRIPCSNYHWVWGARAWTKVSAIDAAKYLIEMYRPGVIFQHNARGMARRGQDPNLSHGFNGVAISALFAQPLRKGTE